MKTNVRVEEKTRQLLAVLDDETVSLEKSIKWLEQLKEFIIKRDHVSLESLLKEVRAASDTYAVSEYTRQSLRRELSEMLQIDSNELCLSKIADVVSGDVKRALLEKRKRLTQLTDVLKKQCRMTTMLVRECARLNTLMLNNLLQLRSSDTTTTYTANGRASRTPRSALMNYHL